MVTVEVDPAFSGAECGDVAVTAAEGGINYWARVSGYDYTRWQADAKDVLSDNLEVADDFVFFRITCENPTAEGVLRFDVTPAVIKRGLKLGLEARARTGKYWPFQYLEGQPRDEWAECFDADLADVVIQFGVFGDVVFG